MHRRPTIPPSTTARPPTPAQIDAWKARAVALHTTFVQDLVEAHDFCPWAKSARVADRSRIHAVFLADLPTFFEETIRDDAHQKVEVWQLVVPDAACEAMPWRAQVAALEQRLRKDGHDLPWAFAAFHPEHPGRPQSIGGVIGMLRRSPLPAIQLVHLDVLDRVRAKAAAQVEGLPQHNHHAMQQWLGDAAQIQEHAQWLQHGRELLAEIQNFRAENHRADPGA